MTTLNIILTSILVLCSIVLIAAVLMQQTKSFTARGQAASREAKLQKITVVAAIIIGVLAILIMILA